MTDKEKRELKDGVVSIFKRFNILDHTSTIGNLRDDIIRYIDSLQEEPVSEELEEAAKHYLYSNILYDDVYVGNPTDEDCIEMFKAGAKWQEKQDQYIIELAEDHAMFAGMEKMREQMMKNIWKPADGDDLPEIDREVIALLDNGKVVFAHRPNPEGYEAKSLASEESFHYVSKCYDKGGWNIPNVKYWLDTNLPNMED